MTSAEVKSTIKSSNLATIISYILLPLLNSFYRLLILSFAKMASVTGVISRFLEEYSVKTPQRLKIIDAYLTYIIVTGIVQFLYCCLVGTFPFNSFLSGFISCVGSFVLAVCLRVQSNPANKEQFTGISAQRAFGDFIFAHCVLHLVTMNFLG
eukprot:scpid80161/ scgid15912/ Dolichyl-diphosphooligosaccharide--protein glycosyltransferase subunit DAD1; Defender against cell death 1; Dolichyl-diphosphooligosaccharide--protein glycosyltransferase subunit DAD1; Defender against cell death 1; Dolichyl-diphosphooligosaccharide--protein glycosyltransferase subunit DAD1; Defender against cell death 1; Dolichyl-diphosphooligosaccharide--protein glycosyltransferase subunit DAD1; Defender against cell death 1